MDNEYKIQLILEAQNKMSWELSKVQAQMQSLEKTNKTTAWGMQSAISALAWIGGLLWLKNVIGQCITAASEQARVNRQLEATLKSTGNAAWLSSKQIQDMATNLSLQTWITDDTIQASQNMLLTFTNIWKDVFPKATEAVLDMATAMNGGATPGADQLRATSIQLGKALQDPILGMTALRRVWVNFSAENKKTVETMLKSNNLMWAQKFILAELTKEFGWSATAQATASAKLAVAMDWLKEAIGGTLLPTLNSFKEAMIPIITTITKWINENPVLAKTIMVIVTTIVSLLSVLAIVWPAIAWISLAFGAMAWPIGIAIVWIWLLAGALAMLTSKHTEESKKSKELTQNYEDLYNTTRDYNALKLNKNADIEQLKKYEAEIDRLKGKIADAINAELQLWAQMMKADQAKQASWAGNVAEFGTAWLLKYTNALIQQSWALTQVQQWLAKAQTYTAPNSASGLSGTTKWISDQQKAIEALTKSMKELWYTQKEIWKAQSTASKLSLDWINDLGTYYKTLQDKVQSSFDNINDKIKSSYENIMDYQLAIKALQKQLLDLETEQTNSVAQSYLSSQKELWSISYGTMLEDIAKMKKELQATNLTEVGRLNLQKQLDEAQKKYLETVQSEKQIKDNLASAFAWLNDEQAKALQDQIDKQTAYNNMTDIEKIRKDYEEKTKLINDEIALKNQSIFDETNKIRTLNSEKIALENQYKWILNINHASELAMYDELIQKAKDLWIIKAGGTLPWMPNTPTTPISYPAPTWKSQTGSGTDLSRLTPNNASALLLAKQITKAEYDGYMAYLAHRASWGSVTYWTPYVVWEKWPELFVPNSNGTIVPNNKLWASSTTITINMWWVVIREEADINKIANALARIIQKRKNFNYS